MTTPVPARPEPVMEAAQVAAAVSGFVVAVGAALVLVGWITAAQVQAWAVIAGGIVTALGALLTAALPLITARGARAQVTPLADPHSISGRPLSGATAWPVRNITPDLPGEHAVDV